jgi:hypothetical protein
MTPTRAHYHTDPHAGRGIGRLLAWLRSPSQPPIPAPTSCSRAPMPAELRSMFASADELEQLGELVRDLAVEVRRLTHATSAAQAASRPASEPPAPRGIDRPLADHVCGLLEFAAARHGGERLTASELMALYRAFLAQRGWRARPWNSVAAATRKALGARKGYVRMVDACGRPKRCPVYPIPAVLRPRGVVETRAAA